MTGNEYKVSRKEVSSELLKDSMYFSSHFLKFFSYAFPMGVSQVCAAPTTLRLVADGNNGNEPRIWYHIEHLIDKIFPPNKYDEYGNVAAIGMVAGLFGGMGTAIYGTGLLHNGLFGSKDILEGAIKTILTTQGISLSYEISRVTYRSLKRKYEKTERKLGKIKEDSVLELLAKQVDEISPRSK